METDSDSDSDGSHISATPPRAPPPRRRRPSPLPPATATAPETPAAPTPLPLLTAQTPLPQPLLKARAPSKCKNNGKPKSKSKSSDHGPPGSLLPPPDRSRLPFVPLKIPSWNNQSASLSSSVMSRKTFFDSAIFGQEEVAKDGHFDPPNAGEGGITGNSGCGGDRPDKVSLGLPRQRGRHLRTVVGSSSDASVSTVEAPEQVVRSGKRSLKDETFDDGGDGGHCVDVGSSETLHQQYPMRGGARVRRTKPNWIGGDSGLTMTEEPYNFKRSNEGNFVRLNLGNYRGRKFMYRNGKRKFPAWSRSTRYRRKVPNGRRMAGGRGGAKLDSSEMDLDSGELWRQEGSVECSGCSIEEAIVAAREDPSDENLKKLLKLTHSYDSFREGQLEAIKRVLAGESTMLVLPTGAGKSLCYQLSALILPGMTLVVSPLVSLMVDQLKKMPPVISGGLLCSSQTSEETSETLDWLRQGKLKVLFVAPERLLDAKFLTILREAPVLSLVVVDEAHCLSEWSHNFRPSYLRLRASVFKAKLQAYCVLAMTATATAQTLDHIMCSLEIKPSNLIQTCQIRENLELHATLSENRSKDLLMLIKCSPLSEVRSIIVYCKFQSETDLVSKYLRDNNIPAKSYHSGIPAKDRNHIQELFCLNKIRVVVATVAFGMGLDKSDVGAVIHYSLPRSFEEYVQETGRAGRDGRLSYCYLLLDDNIYYKLRSLLYSDGVDEYAVNKLLCQIFESTDLPGKICSLVKELSSRRFDMKEEVLLTILTQLELGEVQYICLLPQINATCTLHFHKTSPDLLSDRNVVTAAILKKAEAKRGEYVFDIPTVANSIGITANELLNHLQKLKSMGEITYDTQDPSFCYTIMNTPKDIISLSAELTKWLTEVERCKRLKLDAMFDAAIFATKECKKIDGCSYSLHTGCMQRKILDYFGRGNDISQRAPSTAEGSSPFLRADIKVFLQSNSHVKFTPRAVARIMHGIPSPAFPSMTWSKSHFWGRYAQVDFPVVMKAATMELLKTAGKGGAL